MEIAHDRHPNSRLAWSTETILANKRQIVDNMQFMRGQSRLADLMDSLQVQSPLYHESHRQTSRPQNFQLNYQNVLQSIVLALSHLQAYTIGRQEHGLIEQFIDYAQRLLDIQAASAPEDQFSHLYALRKWLFWIPATILKGSEHDYLTLVFLSHLYAMALAVEPLFPDVAGSMVSAMSLPPLEKLLATFEELRTNPAGTGLADTDIQNIFSLMIWPQQVVTSYRSRQAESIYGTSIIAHSPIGLDDFSSDLMQATETFSIPQPSPAFAAQRSSRVSTSSSWSSGQGSVGSPYLELPTLASNPPRGRRDYSVTSMSAGYDPNEALFMDTQFDYTGFVHSPPPLWT